MEIKSGLNQIIQGRTIYLDQNIWCGLADNHSKYAELRKSIERVIKEMDVLFPYSMWHIHELAEIGREAGVPLSERIKKTEPKLNFIRQISSSVLLEACQSYTKFNFKIRDPFEAFTTVTQVEIKAVSIDSFVNMIPSHIIEEVQRGFDLGAEKLNNMAEEMAIQEVNAGFVRYSNKCQTDEDFLKQAIARAQNDVEVFFTRANVMALSSIDEMIERIPSGYEVPDLTDEVRKTLDNGLKYYEDERVRLKSGLAGKIKEAKESAKVSFDKKMQPYSFEMLLDAVVANDNESVLPKSIYKTLLLDFFGFNSKLRKRRSDYYDAFHRVYANAVHFFVTDDVRFQEKLGGLGNCVTGAESILLNSEGLHNLIKNKFRT